MFKRKIPNQKYYSNRGNDLRARRAFNNKLHIAKDIAVKLSIVLLFGGVIYAIFFTPILAVKDIAVEGNKVVNSDDIRGVIVSVTEQKIFRIFNNNILLISPADMENAIMDRFANIESVKVEKKFPQAVKVAIKEKPADIAWCNKIKVEKVKVEKNVSGEDILASEIPQCYLSDEEGVIYEKIGDNVAAESIKVFRDESIEIGDKISDESLKNFIRKIFYNFNSKTGLDLSYLYILPSASRELHLVTGGGWKIYFDLNRGADEQISDLSAFIKDELKKNNNKSMDYDYIDLRVVDRIIVKQKNETK
jgi:cell division septal protein FtsQ